MLQIWFKQCSIVKNTDLKGVCNEQESYKVGVSQIGNFKIYKGKYALLRRVLENEKCFLKF